MKYLSNDQLISINGGKWKRWSHKKCITFGLFLPYTTLPVYHHCL